MGSPGADRQYDRTRPVVAFDFDGTLTVRDSFLAFLRFQAGPGAYALGCLKLIPATVAYLFSRDRAALKSAAARVFLAGMTPDELDEAAQRFASLCAARLLRPDAAQVWRDWKAQGAVMVIVTASPEPVVTPFARHLDADVLIGTQMAVRGGRITGEFSSANCRAAEKPARLRAWFGDDVHLAAAYGDTSGDTEMLAMAGTAGYRVFKGKP